MNPLIDNLYIMKQTCEQSFLYKEEAIAELLKHMKKGFTVEYEEYWKDDYPIHIIKWYKIVK